MIDAFVLIRADGTALIKFGIGHSGLQWQEYLCEPERAIADLQRVDCEDD